MKMKLFEVVLHFISNDLAITIAIWTLRRRIRSIGVAASHDCGYWCCHFLHFLSNYGFFVQNGNKWAMEAVKIAAKVKRTHFEHITGNLNNNNATQTLYFFLFYTITHRPYTSGFEKLSIIYISKRHIISDDNSKWHAGDFIIHKLFKRCMMMMMSVLISPYVSL